MNITVTDAYHVHNLGQIFPLLPVIKLDQQTTWFILMIVSI